MLTVGEDLDLREIQIVGNNQNGMAILENIQQFLIKLYVYYIALQYLNIYSGRNEIICPHKDMYAKCIG